MVSEFETLDKLNQINDALDANEIATAKDVLMVLKDKYQTMCDEFDKWAEEESQRQDTDNRIFMEGDCVENQTDFFK